LSGTLSPPAAGRPVATGRAAQDRSAVATAAGTAVSRLTGLIRLVMVAFALGGARLADSFNLANNTPNMIHDLVLGGVLAATFVPVFVDRLARCSPEEAERSIAAVVTASLALLVAATLLFELAAPAIVDLYTMGSTDAPERALAVTLLRWFCPQLLCYGVISLVSALLATRHRFAAVGIAPVANNLVAIGVLAAFAVAAGHHPSVAGTIADPHLVVLLGLGTTLGVAIQALCLWPSMRRAGIRLRPVWSPHDPAVRSILQLSGWTLGFVAANQLAVFVVLALEVHTGAGGVSAYTYAYTFFMLPFGIVAVSVVNVATPDLARLYSAGRSRDLGLRFGVAARQVLALVLPATVGYLVLARQIVPLVIRHGAEGQASASTTAATLAMFALGLPAFCIFLLAIRTLQAMQDTRTAFVLYVLENATNILVALLLYRTVLGVRGLALAYSIAYVVAALAALAVLRERLGTIGGRTTLRVALRSLWLSLAMAAAVAFVAALVGSGSGVLGWVHLLAAVLAGAVVYLGGAGCAAAARAWQTSRRRDPEPGALREPKGASRRHVTIRGAGTVEPRRPSAGNGARPAGPPGPARDGAPGGGSANPGGAGAGGGRHRQRGGPSR
jgi:putative peptidoglycan lipid II flippase